MNSITKRLRLAELNPVIIRDLRMRMRGAKTYWGQAAYLLVLGSVALVGYSTSIESDTAYNVVDIQRKLQQFYYFIFICLAALITLIAPALTASSITSEKQRLTLDLLITTPLTSNQLLFGKLVSSVAYLGLLLSLSLPFSVLCVLLGGVTIGEVFRIYLLLAVDGLLLSAIGIYYSCTNRKSGGAISLAYTATLGVLILTAYFIDYMTRTGDVYAPSMVIAVLNPFVSIYYGGGFFQLFGATIPLCVGTGVLALLLVRFLLTAASYLLGNFGGNPIASLRRQCLVLTVVGILLVERQNGLLVAGAMMAGGMVDPLQSLIGLLGAIFSVGVFFFPSLFVPRFDEEIDEEQRLSGYRISCIFSKDHAGALPFFHLWILTLFTTTIVMIGWKYGMPDGKQWASIFQLLFYASGIGYFYWAIARRVGQSVQSWGGAKAITFFVFAVLHLFPLMAISVTSGSDIQSIYLFSILAPLTKIDGMDALALRMGYGVALYLLGTVVFPFWRPVRRAARPPRHPKPAPAPEFDLN